MGLVELRKFIDRVMMYMRKINT